MADGLHDEMMGDDWIENEFTGGGDLWGHAGLDVQVTEPEG